MKTISKLLLITFMATFLSGCQNMNKQSGGTVIGGIAGGLIGSQFGSGTGALLAVGVGAIAGSLIGGQIGKSMDERDKLMATKSSQEALEYSPSGNMVEWKNPDSGNRGSITPTKTFRDNGRYCREYTQEVVVAEKKQQAYGQACRQPDGSWEIIK